MERHRLFKLDTPLTLMGFELDDWLVLIGGWALFLQVLGTFLGPRPKLLFATILAGAVFLAYRRVKDMLPGKFGRHLIGYLSEADTYRVTPDDVNVPCVLPPGVSAGEPGGPERARGRPDRAALERIS